MIEVKDIKLGGLLFIPSGTKIFSVSNQLNFILDELAIVRVDKYFVVGKPCLFVNPQWITINIPICKASYIDCGTDSWNLSLEDVYEYNPPENSIGISDYNRAMDERINMK
jgi:hypothetical protein